MRKKIVISLLTVLLLCAVWQFELILYGIAQGRGQLKIINETVEVDDLMKSATFSDSLKQKIEIIQKAKEFAVVDLGLLESDNYTTYYDEGDAVTLWNVSACAPFALEPKTWWFPFVGNVPYKGYFEKVKAEKLLADLKSEGLDARMRPVGGWSTLGWFRDPILSSMLERSEGQLGELIIHELTHGTIFVKNKVAFNENLASFIGEKGAIEFLNKRYGPDSPELAEYLSSENDSELFTQHILEGTRILDQLYNSFENEPDSIKLERKNKLIAEICSSIDTISFTNKRYYNIFKSQMPNNSYFMSFLRYHSAGDSLQNMLEANFDGDLKMFIKDAIEKYGS